MKKFASMFVLSAFCLTLLALTGCGGSSSNPAATPVVTSFTENTYGVYGNAGSQKLKVDPSVVVLPDGVTPPTGYTSVTATITSNSDGTTVTTDANGKFKSGDAVSTDAKNAASTDPSQQPDVTVTATVGGSQVTGTATISIAATASSTDIPVGLKVIPHEFKAPVSGTFFMQALRTNADGKVIKASGVTWTASSCPSGTTITAQTDTAFAVLTTGATAGTACQITASILDSNKNATATDTAKGDIVSDSDAVTVAVMAHDYTATHAAWPKAAVNLDCFSGTYTAANPPPPDVRPAHFVAIADAAGNATVKVFMKNATCKVALGVPDPKPAPANNIYCSVIGTAATAGSNTCPPAGIIAIGTTNITTTHIYAIGTVAFKPPAPMERLVRMAWWETQESRQRHFFDPERINSIKRFVKRTAAGSDTLKEAEEFTGWTYTLEKTTASSGAVTSFKLTLVNPQKVEKHVISCDIANLTCTFEMYMATFATTADVTNTTTAVLVRKGKWTETLDSTATDWYNGDKLVKETNAEVEEYFMDTPDKVAFRKKIRIVTTYVQTQTGTITAYKPSTSTITISRYRADDTSLAKAIGTFTSTRTNESGNFDPSATTVSKVVSFTGSAEDKVTLPDGVTTVTFKNTFDGYINSDQSGQFTFTDKTTKSDGTNDVSFGAVVVVNLNKPTSETITVGTTTVTVMLVAGAEPIPGPCTVKAMDAASALQQIATFKVDMKGNVYITKTSDNTTQQVHL